MASVQPHDARDSEVVHRVRGLRAAYRPLDPIRELHDWVRGMAYTGAPDGDESRELAAALPALAAPVRSGSLVDQVAGRDFIAAIQALAEAAGYPALEAAARLEVGKSTWVGNDWTDIRDRVHEVTAALPGEVYERLLVDAYALPLPLADARTRLEAALDDEARQLRDRCEAVGRGLDGSPVMPEDVMTVLGRVRTPAEDALTVAQRMVARALPALERVHGGLLSAERALVPAPTPAAAEALGTEGEAFAADVLGQSPVVRCWVTPAKCGSVYSLANVVFHELLHAWHMHRGATTAQLAPLQRIVTPWAGFLVEGLAMRRERELFELFRDAESADPVRQLFAEVAVPYHIAVAEFDVDTRYWWVIRLVRGLFELEVQAGRVTYHDFVRSTAARTGLSEARVHGACFPFFERPGWALTYSLGRMLVDDLAGEAAAAGVPDAEFGVRVLSMGMLPAAAWRVAILRADHRGAA